jgi:hypothetical protein
MGGDMALAGGDGPHQGERGEGLGAGLLQQRQHVAGGDDDGDGPAVGEGTGGHAHQRARGVQHRASGGVLGQRGLQLQEGEGLVEHLHRMDAGLQQSQHASPGGQQEEEHVPLAGVGLRRELQCLHVLGGGQPQDGQVPLLVQGDDLLHLDELVVGEEDMDLLGPRHHVEVGDEVAPWRDDEADPLAARHFKYGESGGCQGCDRLGRSGFCVDGQHGGLPADPYSMGTEQGPGRRRRWSGPMEAGRPTSLGARAVSGSEAGRAGGHASDGAAPRAGFGWRA